MHVGGPYETLNKLYYGSEMKQEHTQKLENDALSTINDWPFSNRCRQSYKGDLFTGFLLGF